MIRKILLYKRTYFSEPDHNKNKIEIKLDLSNYATKSDIRNATAVDRWKFTEKDGFS